MVVGGVDAYPVAWAARIIGKIPVVIFMSWVWIESCIRQHAGANSKILVFPVHHVLVIMLTAICTRISAAAANLDVNVPIGGRVAAVLLEYSDISRTACSGIKFRVFKVIFIISRDTGIEQHPCPAVHGRIADGGQARPILQQVGLFLECNGDAVDNESGRAGFHDTI